MAVVCLTYSRRDADAAGDIAEVLELVNHEVRHHIYDSRDTLWTEESLVSALARADRWLLILSANSVLPEVMAQRIEAVATGGVPLVGVSVGSAVAMDWGNRLPKMTLVDFGADPATRSEALLAAVRPNFEEVRHEYGERMAALEVDLKTTLADVVNDEATAVAERSGQIFEACLHFKLEEAAFWQGVELELLQRLKEVEAKHHQIMERARAVLDERMQLLNLLSSGRSLVASDRLVQRLRDRAGQPLVIPQALYDRLRTVLLACDQFGSNQELRAIFSDSRLSPWRHGLPEAGSVSARVDAVIGYLRDKRSRDQESALVLFIRVLSDRYQDSLHERLVELAEDLEAARIRQLMERLKDEGHALDQQKRLLSSESDAMTDLMETVRQGKQDKVPIYEAVEQVLSIAAKGERQALERLREAL